MSRLTCSIDHHLVATSPDLNQWLRWPRVCIEDYTLGKTFETRRCPLCHNEFKRQIFICSVVYPVEVATEQQLPESLSVERVSAAGSTGKEWPAAPADFARVLRRRRELAGLTRVELSAVSGVCDSTIRNIELGRHIPNSRTIGKLITVAELQAIAVRENAVEVPAPQLRVSVQSVALQPVTRMAHG